MDKDEALKLLQEFLRDRSGIDTDKIEYWNRMRSIPKPIDLSGVNLSGLFVVNLKFTNINFTDAELNNAIFDDCDFRNANLSRANLRKSRFWWTDFTGANLSEADLTEADFQVARLQGINVNKAKFDKAVFGGTVIACNLSNAFGLEKTEHTGASHIDINSALSLKDNFSEEFLRGCGLRDTEVDYCRSQINKHLNFHSCFISYSETDEDFAERLYKDLQKAGIRCWKWNHDAQTGKALWSEIDRAIQEYDKLVLIASETSLKSPAVSREIERAILQEDKLKKLKEDGKYDGDINVLFPVRLDSYILSGWKHERKVDVTSKFIADATNCDNDINRYRRVCDKLIRDLRK